ncbi:DNA primase [Myxococcus sp. CA051A]|uniref:DNA primase n=1 Tax=Myxococcus sp. CA051A TaxID=2741739 RepID=UPI00157A661F|nr:DNA primase [Myxococcus sp. CA051A]NTX67616.1 DNA primase [Myxococcus sp. CA051A]
MVPAGEIAAILDAVDLVDLVSRHVTLKPEGKTHKGKCPFHQEDTPSFYVLPNRRRWKCHGCGETGDAIAFLQRLRGLTFRVALQQLAADYGGRALATSSDPHHQERTQALEALRIATAYYQAQLLNHPAAPRAYLATRGISDSAVTTFGLGWAPPDSSLATVLHQAGLASASSQLGLTLPVSGHDFLRGRIVFPIRTTEGRTTAFGGRTLESGPKYVNSRESLLYSKSDTLFGVDQAHVSIRQTRTAVLVEGYLDAIALHQGGIRNAVALCGTGLTPGHLRLLTRLGAQRLVLLLDPDPAGTAAIYRAAPHIFGAQLPTYVALLPDGYDPDDYIRASGPAATASQLNNAQPLSAYLLSTAFDDSTSMESQLAGLQRLRPIILAIPHDSPSVGMLVAQIATTTGMSRDDVAASLQLPSLPEPPPPPQDSVLTALLLTHAELRSDVLTQAATAALRADLRLIAEGQLPLTSASLTIQTAVATAARELPQHEWRRLYTTLARALALRHLDAQLVRAEPAQRVELLAQRARILQ